MFLDLIILKHRSIFKRRGNQSGTVEAAESGLIDILNKEDMRKQAENEMITQLATLELTKPHAKKIIGMAVRINEITEKIKTIKFPFQNVDYQVQEIMNGSCSNFKVPDYEGIVSLKPLLFIYGWYRLVNWRYKFSIL
jgi:hypothetical protein